MIIKGDYGTIFECDEYSQSSMPVIITTEAGNITLPISDIFIFCLDYKKHHNEKPLQVSSKASIYVKKAIEAATEHQKEINTALTAQLKTAQEALKKYGSCTYSCLEAKSQDYDEGDSHCSCGFEQALKPPTS